MRHRGLWQPASAAPGRGGRPGIPGPCPRPCPRRALWRRRHLARLSVRRSFVCLRFPGACSGTGKAGRAGSRRPPEGGAASDALWQGPGRRAGSLSCLSASSGARGGYLPPSLCPGSGLCLCVRPLVGWILPAASRALGLTAGSLSEETDRIPVSVCLRRLMGCLCLSV